MTARAFTLLEVVLAIALLVILSAGVAAFAWNIIDARARVLEAVERDRAAGAIFEAVERALASATLAAEGFNAEPAALRLATRDARAALDADTPALARRTFELRFHEADQRVTVALARGSDQLPASFERVQVRSFNGREWVDRFDAAQVGRFPHAVEIALWFAPSEVGARARRETPPGLPMTNNTSPTAAPVPDDDPFGVAAAVRIDDLPEGVSRPPDRVRIFALLDPGTPSTTGGAAP